MSVHKKGNLWYASVYLGTKNGKEEREWSKGFEKKSDAQLKELEMKKAVIEAEHKVYSKESFIYVSAKWLEVREKTVAKTTYRQNKSYFDIYIHDYFMDKLVKDIDTLTITEFMLSIEKSPATINKTMNILKQIFDFAITLHCIRHNPCEGVKKPAIRKKKKKTLSPEQIKKFLSYKDVKEATCYTALWILFSTGMRPGEVCGLRWCDWYDDYFIPEIGIDNKREITDLKNDKAHDPIYIDIKLQKHLDKLYNTQKTIYLSQGIEFSSECYVNCLEPDMRPMTGEYLYKRLKVLLERHSLPPCSLYEATRHSFGTNMMKEGVNPKMVADMMRHSTVRTTLDNYSHTDKKMYKNTVRLYNNKIG